MITDIIPQANYATRYIVRYGRQCVAVDALADGTFEPTIPLGCEASPRAVRAALEEVRAEHEEGL